MDNIYNVRLGLPLADDEPSYLVVTGDEFRDGYTVYVSGRDFLEMECHTRYVGKTAADDPDLLVARWLNPRIRPGTGEVDVTITVKEGKEEKATARARVVQIVKGDLPPRRRSGKGRAAKGQMAAKTTAKKSAKKRVTGRKK